MSKEILVTDELRKAIGVDHLNAHCPMSTEIIGVSEDLRVIIGFTDNKNPDYYIKNACDLTLHDYDNLVDSGGIIRHSDGYLFIEDQALIGKLAIAGVNFPGAEVIRGKEKECFVERSVGR